MSYPNYHSSIDFSGIWVHFLPPINPLFTYEGLDWHDLMWSHTEMLQTDLTTGKQRKIQRSYNIERRWRVAYDTRNIMYSITLEQWVADMPVSSTVSCKMKMKQWAWVKLNSLLPQLFLLQCSPGLLGEGRSHASISGDHSGGLPIRGANPDQQEWRSSFCDLSGFEILGFRIF